MNKNIQKHNSVLILKSLHNTHLHLHHTNNYELIKSIIVISPALREFLSSNIKMYCSYQNIGIYYIFICVKRWTLLYRIVITMLYETLFTLVFIHMYYFISDALKSIIVIP